jgi:ribosomal protein S18 acetylase RimI-like enzyme
MEFDLYEVTSDEDFLTVLPLMQKLLIEEDTKLDVILPPEKSHDSWKKAQKYGYRIYAARAKDAQLLAVVGLTELLDPLSEYPSFRLNNFIVDAPFRSQGIGAEIMGKMERIAQEAGGKYLILEVLGHNEKAIRFYREKMNYRYICNRMLKNLSP